MQVRADGCRVAAVRALQCTYIAFVDNKIAINVVVAKDLLCVDAHILEMQGGRRRKRWWWETSVPIRRQPSTWMRIFGIEQYSRAPSCSTNRNTILCAPHIYSNMHQNPLHRFSILSTLPSKERGKKEQKVFRDVGFFFGNSERQCTSQSWLHSA